MNAFEDDYYTILQDLFKKTEQWGAEQKTLTIPKSFDFEKEDFEDNDSKQ